ncbi:MAG: transposase, partial [Myxococcota bacterium]|nr:transposase [Myxococcota bacterium]
MHAERAIDGRDRAQIERLCRYLARPALAQERLERHDEH